MSVGRLLCCVSALVSLSSTSVIAWEGLDRRDDWFTVTPPLERSIRPLFTSITGINRSDNTARDKVRIVIPGKDEILGEDVFGNKEKYWQKDTVRDAEFFLNVHEVAKDNKPWSSWWFPKDEGYLWKDRAAVLAYLAHQYKRHGETLSNLQRMSDAQILAKYREDLSILPSSSALRRYDFVQYYYGVRGVKRALNAEWGRYRSESKNEWAGLCFEFSMASILESEPKGPVTIGRTTFSVGDLKGLLLMSYEGLKGRQVGNSFYDAPDKRRAAQYDFFGQKNMEGATSEAAWGGFWFRPEDIYADQFHKMIENEIAKDGQPFIMDYDPDIEVWTVPVWKVRLKYYPDPKMPDNRLNVVATVHYSDFLQLKNSKNTTNFHNDKQTFIYSLMGHTKMEGGKKVFYADWGDWVREVVKTTDTQGREKVMVNDSMNAHPDYVIRKPRSPVRRTPKNEGIRVDVIEAILKGRNTL